MYVSAECFLVNDHLNQALEDQLWKNSKTGFNLANYNMNNSLSVSTGRLYFTCSLLSLSSFGSC